MKTIINLTPHNITIILRDGIITIPRSNMEIPRISVEREKVGEINGIDIYQNTYGEPTNLPERRENTIYIVSALLQNACPDREDFYSVGELVRDAEGRVVGTKGLVAPQQKKDVLEEIMEWLKKQDQWEKEQNWHEYTEAFHIFGGVYKKVSDKIKEIKGGK